MRHLLSPSRAIAVAGLAMLVLLSILAVLQYRWLGEISEAEKDRMLARMQSSAARFARDFDREVTRAFLLLDPAGPARRPRETAAERRARWTATALFPDLVRAVFVASPAGGARLTLARLDEGTGALVPEPWPDELGGLRSRLERGDPLRAPGWVPRRGRAAPAIASNVPALVAPIVRPGPPAPAGEAIDPPFAASGGYVVVWLSLDVIERKLLPELAARHFAGTDGLEYRLEVISLADPWKVIYRAGPSLGAAGRGRSDAQVGLLGFLGSEESESPGPPPGRGPWREPPGGEPLPDAAAAPPAVPPGGPGGPGSILGPPRPQQERPWRLLVTHPSGSLEAAVASARHRNLAHSFGTLLLLALSLALALISTRRAQRLARQQLEFTAGVTHELATPLAGMRSAAQNLADGVVRDPAQVREYGALIDREGRRLTEMVQQVLAFAGLQGGRAAFARRPVTMERVIDEALAAWKRPLDEKGFRVEKKVAAGLPEVAGDGPALRRALENLIGNAVKYAADGAWIGIRASVAEDHRRRHLAVTVEDRGPGIAPADLPHVFEPFYRGRGRSAGTVAGSGLGLTVVRGIVNAHEGWVTVRNGPDKGTAVTLHLPLAEG